VREAGFETGHKNRTNNGNTAISTKTGNQTKGKKGQKGAKIG